MTRRSIGLPPSVLRAETEKERAMNHTMAPLDEKPRLHCPHCSWFTGYDQPGDPMAVRETLLRAHIGQAHPEIDQPPLNLGGQCG